MKEEKKGTKGRRKITVTKDGPYLLSGSIPLAKEIIISDTERTPLRWERGMQLPARETSYLCRCGHSKNKPFCDGAHIKEGFDGTETATHEPHLDRAETTAGPRLVERCQT